VIGRDLVVISARPETSAILGEMLSGSPWKVRPCRSNGEGLRWLSVKGAAVVISEAELADGDWRDVLESIQLLPRLIVTARHADEQLWAEVLNLGGHDVLAQPFDKNEVARVLAAAHQAAPRR